MVHPDGPYIQVLPGVRASKERTFPDKKNFPKLSAFFWLLLLLLLLLLLPKKSENGSGKVLVLFLGTSTYNRIIRESIKILIVYGCNSPRISFKKKMAQLPSPLFQGPCISLHLKFPRFVFTWLSWRRGTDTVSREISRVSFDEPKKVHKRWKNPGNFSGFSKIIQDFCGFSKDFSLGLFA